MTTGAGKYDAVATVAREMAQAEAVAVIVFNGSRGNGFSVQAEVKSADAYAALLLRMPDVLRDMARQIEADLRAVGRS